MASIKADVKETMKREAAKEESRILRALDVDVIKLEDYVRNARDTRDRGARREAEDESRSPGARSNRGEVPDGDIGWYESSKVLSKTKNTWDYASLIRSVLFVPVVETRFEGAGKGEEEMVQSVVGCVVVIQHKQEDLHQQQRFGHQEAKWLCNFCDVASRSLQQVCEVDTLRLQLAEARAREATLISRLTEVSNHAHTLAIRGVHRSMTGCLLEQTRVVLGADASAVFVTRLVWGGWLVAFRSLFFLSSLFSSSLFSLLSSLSLSLQRLSPKARKEMQSSWTRESKTYMQRRQDGS